MIILIDTREQRPYEFKTPSIRGKLDIGDYSLLGAESLIAVERKSLCDLIGCLCGGRERFKKELFRGQALDYFAIVIEATLTDIANGNYRSKMTPKSAIQSLLTFSIRYRLPVFFAENRNFGARVTESLLLKFAKELERRTEAILKAA